MRRVAVGSKITTTTPSKAVETEKHEEKQHEHEHKHDEKQEKGMMRKKTCSHRSLAQLLDDEASGNCSPKLICSTPVDFDCIPEHAIERFIITGYRLNLTWREAFLSLFSLHNETMYVLFCVWMFCVLCIVWAFESFESFFSGVFFIGFGLFATGKKYEIAVELFALFWPLRNEPSLTLRFLFLLALFFSVVQ